MAAMTLIVIPQYSHQDAKILPDQRSQVKRLAAITF
jgi:pantothenate kinase